MESVSDKMFLSPDYSEDESDDIVIDDSEDEGAIETALDIINNTKEERKEEQFNMTPFQSQTQFQTPNWNIGGGLKPNTGQQVNNSFTQDNNNTDSFWNTQKPNGSFVGWGNNNLFQQQKNNNTAIINRDKQVIICDFLDVIAETYESKGQAGLLPRDIYDLKPRFDVWYKLKAYNPTFIYGLVPRILIPNTNGAQGWVATLDYYCCCLSSFLRLPYTNCQMIVSSVIGESKENIINQVLNNIKIDRTSVVYIGIYSGAGGQSNEDIRAANLCQVDYVDLSQLLNSVS